MLQNTATKHYPWEKETERIKKFNNFLTSPAYILCTGALAVIANLFGAEIFVYSLYVLCGIYLSFFGRDYLPLIPLVINCYISPSLHNNPGRNADSIFYPLNGGIYLAVLVVLFASSVIFRLTKDKEMGGKKFLSTKRRLISGMLALGGAYLLAGAFSGRYFEKGPNNFLFALVQFASIFVFYWFFTGAVKWDKARKDILAWSGLNVGLIVCCEVIGVYISEGVISNNSIDPKLIASGWGNANNLGCMIAMMIPFAFCLIEHYNRGWIFGIISIIMIAITCLTCSRTSIGAAFIICFICLLLSIKSKKRRIVLWIYGGFAVFGLIFVIIFREKFINLFMELLERGLNPRNRDLVYKEGLEVFLKKPIFGDTFYPEKISVWAWSTLEGFDSIVPNRWHNTVIQILASCGIVGMIAYSIHRIQTIKLFFEKRKTDTIFIGLSLATLLMASLLDCHFFNIGPVLFYSMALAFAEKIEY